MAIALSLPLLVCSAPAERGAARQSPAHAQGRSGSARVHLVMLGAIVKHAAASPP